MERRDGVGGGDVEEDGVGGGWCGRRMVWEEVMWRGRMM